MILQIGISSILLKLLIEAEEISRQLYGMTFVTDACGQRRRSQIKF
jgi:hypothetical protein